jgi:hypothetical protein
VESKLGPLGTSAIYWPIVPAPGECEDGEFGGMNWQGKPKYSEKTCPGSTLSTTNPTWPDPGSNPGRRGGMPATNRLSYGAAWSKQLHRKCWRTLGGQLNAAWTSYVPRKGQILKLFNIWQYLVYK